MAGVPVNGWALKAIRERSGLSRQALADKAGLDASYVALIENERRIPSPLVIWRLTNALQIDVRAIGARAVA